MQAVELKTQFCRHRHDRRKVAQGRDFLRERHQRRLVLDVVRLVNDEDARHVLRNQVQHLLVGRTEHARFNDEQRHVRCRERIRHGLVERLVQGIRMARLEAGRVDVNELRIVDRLDARDAVARRLRLARRDADFRADERIHQRRFTNVGAADDGDIATAEIFRNCCLCHALLL